MLFRNLRVSVWVRQRFVIQAFPFQIVEEWGFFNGSRVKIEEEIVPSFIEPSVHSSAILHEVGIFLTDVSDSLSIVM